MTYVTTEYTTKAQYSHTGDVGGRRDKTLYINHNIVAGLYDLIVIFTSIISAIESHAITTRLTGDCACAPECDRIILPATSERTDQWYRDRLFV